ncbi:MAG: GntR family transcriptional regulator [Eubacteriales bacterium]|nr:GntR family transcriptional regulator [Eubacteriales bacterium]
MDKAQKMAANDRAYNIIKSRILSGEYEPNCKLNEIALSNELGVSRTPVREALSRLEYEMLVTIYPKYGTMVSSINLEVIDDVFQLRKLLEPFIILNYGGMIDRDRVIMALKSQLAIKNEQSAENFHYKADEDLHQIILDANQNKYITEMLMRVYDQNQRIRVLTGAKNRERLLDSCEEHLAILNYLLCRDYLEAAKKMEEHLAASWRATIKLVASKQI